MARTPSQEELAAFIVGHGITDFVSGGKLSRLERDALWKVLKKLGPAAVTTTGRLAGTTAMSVGRALPAAARGVRFVTMRHPYIAAAVVTYEVYKNREQIAQLAREGWEVVSDYGEGVASRARDPAIYEEAFGRLMEGPRPIGAPIPGQKRKRPLSKYNRAMSTAMKAVKASSKGGKKGTLSNPKGVFKTVSKAVSRVNKGLKVTTKGISGIAARAARKVLGKKKKPKKGKATFTYRKN
jgi:hypothetical protein